jgi:hypothetical protein
MITLIDIHHLSDAELASLVKTLAGRAREATAELVAHLAELETRGLHLQAGYGSLFEYCREVLLLSEHEAYNRIGAARAARRFPIILDLLAQGAVTLTAVDLLSPCLTAENHVAVLESARGLRKREVEDLVARLAPKPDVPTSIRRLPSAAVARPAPVAGLAAREATPDPGAGLAVAVASASVPVIAKPAVVSALSPNRYKLQLTIGGDTLEKLRLAKDMLRHAVPAGDDAAVLDRALTVLLAELAKKKFAAADQPRPSPGVAGDSRHIPAEVRRAVFVRDIGRCAFVSVSGHRCDERAFLEFHHVRPYAEDGPPTVGNIALRCRSHNGYEWQRWCEERSRADEQMCVNATAAATARMAVRVSAGAKATCSGTSTASGAALVPEPSARTAMAAAGAAGP